MNDFSDIPTPVTLPVATLVEASTRRRLSDDEARMVATHASTEALFAQAARLRDLGQGDVLSYSRKVFIPLTHLCRDVCHYCTFATTPRKGERAFLSAEQVLEIARAGERAGCHEALFTLGDKPERRYTVAPNLASGMGSTSSPSSAKRGLFGSSNRSSKVSSSGLRYLARSFP